LKSLISVQFGQDYFMTSFENLVNIVYNYFSLPTLGHKICLID